MPWVQLKRQVDWQLLCDCYCAQTVSSCSPKYCTGDGKDLHHAQQGQQSRPHQPSCRRCPGTAGTGRLPGCTRTGTASGSCSGIAAFKSRCQLLSSVFQTGQGTYTARLNLDLLSNTNSLAADAHALQARADALGAAELALLLAGGLGLLSYPKPSAPISCPKYCRTRRETYTTRNKRNSLGLTDSLTADAEALEARGGALRAGELAGALAFGLGGLFVLVGQ